MCENRFLLKISNLIRSKNINILEIGPGNGLLTEKIILKKPSQLTLVEIDKDLINYLKEKYLGIEYIEIINANILDLRLNNKYELIISNLPFNISSQVLVKLALLKNSAYQLILMF